jgi:hypothetical protein
MEWSEVSDVEMDDELPSFISVIKVMNYSVEAVVNTLQEFGEYPEPTLEDVLSVVANWASEDFGCSWGHPVDPMSLIYTDEQQNVLYAPGQE